MGLVGHDAIIQQGSMIETVAEPDTVLWRLLWNDALLGELCLPDVVAKVLRKVENETGEAS